MNQKIPKEKSILTKVFGNESFIEKLFLLFLTALLSGLIIPYVGTEIQRNKARNDIVLQAQSKLLEDVSKTLLTYETLLLDISWFKTDKGHNEEMHKKAFARYSERAVDLLADWRVESIRVKSLASAETSKKLDSFQLTMFHIQDSPMNILYREKGSVCKWEQLHKINADMLFQAQKLISDLAIEMKITKGDI
ncbi:hypothetical protein OQX61_23890 [Pedobacter sp. PLR]|uniref:hypothetical protein n=1 Tax=Pedobacter sp. PLR TaxID=2994465 RepID=UPI0022463126|nr:hypothetical protein [Pedobacter sp. PLR]MCX2454333.1 hypothetical protein [Pedobacter sp. PLR]